jgi:hypothetical protein
MSVLARPLLPLSNALRGASTAVVTKTRTKTYGCILCKAVDNRDDNFRGAEGVRLLSPDPFRNLSKGPGVASAQQPVRKAQTAALDISQWWKV